MKIEKLSFENFKCFKKIDLELGKITLLTGANSSGKSSIIYGILGALQSGEFPFQFSPNGKYVEMGDFQELSYNHKKDNVIRLNFTIQSSGKYDIETQWIMDKTRKLPMIKSMTAKSEYFNFTITKDKTYKLTFEYFKDKDPLKDIDITQITYDMFNLIGKNFKNNNKENEKFDIDLNNAFPIEELKEHINKENKPFVEFNFSDFIDFKNKLLLEGGFQLKRLYDELMNSFVNLDKNINYISSFRLYPKRTYYEQTKTDLKVEKSGERYTDQIILWETNYPQIFKKFKNVLNEVSILSEITSKRLEGGRYELQIKPNKNSALSSLADVGFGISQFLPIIVADLQMSNDSLLFVSQPEIHLHPSIQANFADYLINQIKTTNKTYVIETHSEYLINRIRLAITKNEVNDNEIKSYYFHNNGKEVENFKLEFTKTGQILNAPQEFFDTYMIDVMDIAINAAN